jgi:sarcosine oxidase gamma subunit
MALSIMICDVVRNPFPGEDSTVSRINGASTSVDVTRRTVAVAVSGKRSDWMTSAGSGLP